MRVLFEGRDTAGKGGAINTIAERLNPGQVHIVGLSKPAERERTYCPAANNELVERSGPRRR